MGINIIKNDSPNMDEFELEFGNIVETESDVYYMVVCDGCGQFYFINLSADGFIVLDKGIRNPYKVTCHKKYKIGSKLLEYISGSEIKKVYRKENYKIEIN